MEQCQGHQQWVVSKAAQGPLGTWDPADCHKENIGQLHSERRGLAGRVLASNASLSTGRGCAMWSRAGAARPKRRVSRAQLVAPVAVVLTIAGNVDLVILIFSFLCIKNGVGTPNYSWADTRVLLLSPIPSSPFEVGS